MNDYIIKKLSELKLEIETCNKCNLCNTRKNIVFGEGNPETGLMFVGEGPGEVEDETGRPFVGRSGQLLDKMLEAIDLHREKDFYIANIVKCRPPRNRDPEFEEQELCINYLYKQIKIIKPKIIIALGRIAAQRLIGEDFKVTVQHGDWFNKNNIEIMGVYHPSMLLRFPNKKEETFKDFLKLRDRLKQINFY